MLKKFGWVLAVVLVFSTLCFGKTVTKAVKEIVLKTQQEKLSYSIGMDVAKNLKKQGIEVDPELLMKGFRDGYSDTKALLTDDEIKTVFKNLQQEMITKRSELRAQQGEKNKKAGEAFLALNKAKEGVITLPSGLQYQVVKAGDGVTPKDNDLITAHYRGTLIDGQEFDNSYSRGVPIKFKLSDVIAGWREALQLMKVGAKWQLFIPANLAYGEAGAGETIGPNAVLIFELELLNVEAPKTVQSEAETAPPATEPKAGKDRSKK